jgi:hypothetical protein
MICQNFLRGEIFYILKKLGSYGQAYKLIKTKWILIFLKKCLTKQDSYLEKMKIKTEKVILNTLKKPTIKISWISILSSPFPSGYYFYAKTLWNHYVTLD